MSALEDSLLRKIVRMQSYASRLEEFFGARGCKQRVFEVIDYYVCQHCARNNVLVKGYPVFAQYKAMSALYTKAHFSPTPVKRGRQSTATITIAGHDFLVAQAHFLWWMILHDIDKHLLTRFDEIEEEMCAFKREMARKYRRRQRAKRMRRQGDDDVALGKTATQYAKQAQPVFVPGNK